MLSRRRFIGTSSALAATFGLGRTSVSVSQDASTRSVADLQRLIRGGQVTAVQATKECLARIDHVNPSLNAVVTLCRERALTEAAEADKLAARGTFKGLLHGIPFTVSDSFDTVGVLSTAGTLGRKQFVPAQDATVVARARAAGAILLGKTNTNELSFGGGASADNLVFGRTSNPYDTALPAGGGAAIVAAGGSCFDIGAAFNGRIAAGASGIAALEGTHGRIPRTGHVLGYGGAFDSLLTLGPIVRHAADLEILLRVLLGVDDSDAAMAPVPFERPERVQLRSLRIAYEPGSDAVTRQLEAAGCKMTAASLPRFAELADIRRRYLGADGGEHLRKLLAKFGTSRASPNLDVGGEAVASAEFTRLCETLDALRSEQLAWLESFDLLIRPALDDQAGPVGLPIGTVRAGGQATPVGVQIVGRPWREDVVIAALAHVSRQGGSWASPPL
jgi:amidase